MAKDVENEWLNAENVEKLTLEDAEFIFEQSEKLLKETVDSSNLIVSRTTTLITIVVGFMLAMVGFLFQKYAAVKTFADLQILTCFFSLSYVFRICLSLAKNVQGHDYKTVGAEPKLLLNDFFFKEGEDKQRIKRLRVNEIISFQKRIDDNNIINTKRWSLYDRSLILILYTPIAIVLIYWVLNLIVSLFGALKC
jgi:hypothetical protein